MTAYTFQCFAQSGNAYGPALALDLAGADRAPRWNVYPAIRDWLDRIEGEPRRVHPHDPVPGRPLPVAP
jgi:hypothetical protein